MKKLIMALTVLSSIGVHAATCTGTAPTNMEMVTPVYCYESSEELENSTVFKGLFMDAGSGVIVGFKRFSNKNDLCKKLGFESYVRRSVVIEERDIWTSSQGMLVPGPHNVITALECL